MVNSDGGFCGMAMTYPADSIPNHCPDAQGRAVGIGAHREAPSLGELASIDAAGMTTLRDQHRCLCALGGRLEVRGLHASVLPIAVFRGSAVANHLPDTAAREGPQRANPGGTRHVPVSLRTRVRAHRHGR
jgi:hypothetical protein